MTPRNTTAVLEGIRCIYVELEHIYDTRTLSEGKENQEKKYNYVIETKSAARQPVLAPPPNPPDTMFWQHKANSALRHQNERLLFSLHVLSDRMHDTA